MAFEIVHIVSNLEKVNFGIWNAAITGAAFLQERRQIQSQVWVCARQESKELAVSLPVQWLGNDSKEELRKLIASEKILPGNSVIVSHGCWLRPTRIAHELKKMGFPWVYVPHGMLEPWSMRQGRLKKLVYYTLVEKRLARRADVIRAVSQTEKENLEKRFSQKIALIGNGVDVPAYPEKKPGPQTFLFMARLHHKKGIVPLIRAWKNCMKDSNSQLIIAGPDEGELEKILPYLNDNIRYVGPVYRDAKIKLLKEAHYYLLPSHSEGFPTSVVEAMGYGLIPLISRGCNFPEVFSEGLGYRVEPLVDSIETCLRALKEKKFDHTLSLRNHNFINENYSTDCIARKLFSLYDQVKTSKLILS